MQLVKYGFRLPTVSARMKEMNTVFPVIKQLEIWVLSLRPSDTAVSLFPVVHSLLGLFSIVMP